MSHIPVLLHESIAGLNLKPDGFYIDGTFGRGGHSRAILSQLSEHGRLWAFDKDLSAKTASMSFSDDPRFRFIHDSFSKITSHVSTQKVDGILLDLGVSSPQLDTPERGFSFRQEGPLDMRMDQSSGETVAELLTHISEEALADILFTYGEEKFARKIAKAILAAQKSEPLTTTTQLQAIIASALPFREKHKDPATRTFQALRIFINRELQDLSDFLASMPPLLNSGGRVAIITFHSLEDRLVKQAFQRLTKETLPLRGLPIRSTPPTFISVAQKVKPSDAEEDSNIRSRSALLRVIEKR